MKNDSFSAFVLCKSVFIRALTISDAESRLLVIDKGHGHSELAESAHFMNSQSFFSNMDN